VTCMLIADVDRQCLQCGRPGSALRGRRRWWAAVHIVVADTGRCVSRGQCAGFSLVGRWPSAAKTRGKSIAYRAARRVRSARLPVIAAVNPPESV